MYDIIIVGGGITGASLALSLAQQSTLSIAILESQSQLSEWSSSHYHHRVSAISLASKRFFQSLHIWDDIEKKRVSPYTQIKVWDGGEGPEIHFDSAEIAEPALGYIIENQLIQTVLNEKIKSYAHIDIITGAKLTDYQNYSDRVILKTAEHGDFSASLVIAADGANSWLRQQAGLHLTQDDYEENAIVATVRTSLPHEKIARQIFLPTGPIAFLPLQDPFLSSIVWTLPAQQAANKLTLDTTNFQTELTDAFAKKLGDVTEVSERFIFPLKRHRANQYVKSRLALIGDAAHLVHPLAGQGLNMGLADVKTLSEIIMSAIKNRREFGSLATLRRYERWCKGEHFALFHAIDLIKKIYAEEKQAIKTARTVGLKVMNSCDWMKKMVMKYAVGKI